MKIATKTEPREWKLKQLWECGFRHIEVWTDKEVVNSKAAIELLNSFQFEYVVHAPTSYFDESVIDFATQIDAGLINAHKVVSHDRLSELVQYASQQGIQITIENDSWPASHQIVDDKLTVWPPDSLCSAADVKRLIEQVPGVGVCLDIEHAYLRGEFENWTTYLMSNRKDQYIKHVHLTGYNIGEPQGFHKPVQESDHLVEETIHGLSSIGYEGFLVCEHDEEYHNTEIWTEALNYCNELVKYHKKFTRS